MERTAVVVVDLQGTFADDVPDAGLPVPHSGETVDAIRAFVLEAARDPSVVAIVTSQDWHPEHLPEHMVEPGGVPDFEHKIFTRHGIAGTAQAELHPRFATTEVLEVITDRVKKGQNAAAFSAFEGVAEDGSSLLDILRDKGVERVVVIGWELANCVARTALDASSHGFRTAVVWDLTSVLEPEKRDETLASLRNPLLSTITRRELPRWLDGAS